MLTLQAFGIVDTIGPIAAALGVSQRTAATRDDLLVRGPRVWTTLAGLELSRTRAPLALTRCTPGAPLLAACAAGVTGAAATLALAREIERAGDAAASAALSTAIEAPDVLAALVRPPAEYQIVQRRPTAAWESELVRGEDAIAAFMQRTPRWVRQRIEQLGARRVGRAYAAPVGALLAAKLAEAPAALLALTPAGTRLARLIGIPSSALADIVNEGARARLVVAMREAGAVIDVHVSSADATAGDAS